MRSSKQNKTQNIQLPVNYRTFEKAGGVIGIVFFPKEIFWSPFDKKKILLSTHADDKRRKSRK